MFKIAPPAPAAALQDGKAPNIHVRRKVRELLEKSEAFQALDDRERQTFANNMAKVADFLASPMGVPGNTIPGGLGTTARALEDDPQPVQEATFQERMDAVEDVAAGPFRAEAAREGAEVAGLLLDQVRFDDFVGGLIQNVFQSIVQSSIEQMEQYQELIASVAQSLDSFMDQHVSENQGRDHMVDKFPDLFEIGMDDWGGFDDGPAQPKLKLREGVEEDAALRKVNNSISFENGELKTLDLSDENVEKALVHNARLQLAKQRQQMMASLILMGINRIVVTDGRISAKILYDFRAGDRQISRRSATAMDVARDADGNVQTVRSGESEMEIDSSSERRGRSYDGDGGSEGGTRNAEFYLKGKHKYQDKPVITASASAMTGSETQIQTKVQLAGNVSVNFKSDYLPLEKMATPGMIAAIQGNSSPVDPNVLPSARQVAPAQGEAGATGQTPAGTGTLPAPPS
ncbi:hypothetical protein [Roseobacter sp.]|uniref:hypothetical protein n=1 Tax=Roseobacter sp. TaxID=1907202 RepID=UPI00296602A0|nr:hypothetical protein [Roseobacter sp.]MDW3180851.1 hypothetical protein [Roseobacter sp.]